MADVSISEKVCSKCKVLRPVSDFHKCRASKDGFQARCTPCHKLRKQSPEYKAQCQEYARKFYQENRESELERMKKWQNENADHMAEYRKRFWAENKDVLSEKHRDWMARNPGKKGAITRRYYHANKEHCLSQRAAWGRQNAHKVREIAHRRRARKLATQVERVDYQKILERDGYWCYLCKRDVAFFDVSFDHVVPLARGGTETFDNIRVAHLICNIRKKDRLLEELEDNYFASVRV